MREKTVSEALEQMEQERAKILQAIDARREILTLLPGNIPVPTISNESPTAFFGRPGAWLSWRETGAQILATLEQAGFIPLPVTVVKWDNYRPSPEPGALEDIPKTKGRYALTDATIVAPLWIEPQQHGEPEARAYYEKAGRVFKVTVPAPLTVSLTAKRVEPRGTWYFERGSARLRFPQSWHSNPVVGISHLSRAYVDTEQGLSGSIYFEIFAHEQTEFPLTPSQLLAILQELR